MIIPVRCFTCGKVISHLWLIYIEELEKDKKTPKEILNELGLKRYCCRRMILSHVDLIDKI